MLNITTLNLNIYSLLAFTPFLSPDYEHDKMCYFATKLVRHIIIMNKEVKDFNRIKAVLAEKRKTNMWLAEQMGKTTTTISKWCTNDVQPSIETLFAVAKVLDVDVRELLVSSKGN